MSRGKHVEVRLTEKEASELWSLLFAVLTNGDQWEGYDLPALNRAARKLNGGYGPGER